MIRSGRYPEDLTPRLLLSLILSTEGQDLIECALVVALIAFAATAGISGSGNQHRHFLQHHCHKD
jgi:hypothetical protein